jgi:hypothetical protein
MSAPRALLTGSSDRNTLHRKRIAIAECSVMHTETPLAPGEPYVTVYIVLNDFGPLGRAYCETDEAEADETTIVENISTANIRIRYGWSPSIPPRAGLVM